MLLILLAPTGAPPGTPTDTVTWIKIGGVWRKTVVRTRVAGSWSKAHMIVKADGEWQKG